MTAAESAVRCGLPDVTVVLSDNSTEPEESERLRAFCERGPDSLRYVRPPEPLAMSPHWEWLWHTIRDTFAPTHVTYLTDRLAFTQGSLAALAEAAEGNPDHVISYHWDSIKDATSPVELVQAPWTGQLLELDAAKLIELSSRGVFGDYIPRLMNSVAPVSLLEAVERRFGDVFGAISPDFRIAYRSLAIVDSILYLDRACVIEHGMARSHGYNYKVGNVNSDSADFARLAGERFGATPEPHFETVVNAIFQEYCSTRRELGGDRFPSVDWLSYLRANAASTDRIEAPEKRTRMQELLRARGWTRRHSVRHVAGLTAQMAGYFLHHPAALGRTIKRQLWDRPPGTPAAYLAPKIGLSPGLRDDLLFESSAEALAYANAHPRPRAPYAWHIHQLERAGAVRGRAATLARSASWK